MSLNPCYGIPAEEIARICRVSLKTLLRAQIAGYQAKERQTLAMDEQPEPGALPAIRA